MRGRPAAFWSGLGLNGPCELFAAYDRWEIGSAELPSYSLGLRGWF